MSSVSTIANLVNKAYSEYMKIESDVDLRKNNISLSDYHMLPIIISSLQVSGYADCLPRTVAEWFRNIGFTVLNPNTSENRGIMYRVIANG